MLYVLNSFGVMILVTFLNYSYILEFCFLLFFLFVCLFVFIDSVLSLRHIGIFSFFFFFFFFFFFSFMFFFFCVLFVFFFCFFVCFYCLCFVYEKYRLFFFFFFFFFFSKLAVILFVQSWFVTGNIHRSYQRRILIFNILTLTAMCVCQEI